MNDKSDLQARIQSGKQLLIAELSPPKSGDPESVRRLAKMYAGKVHALGVSDNRDGAAMSALAAASLVVREGIEPILHVVTRDRNRIALISECLGAQALGIRNILCTTGTHQTLGPARAAKNVFDLDSVQLLQTYSKLAEDGSIVGEDRFEGVGGLCLGAVATPYADPPEMQMMRLAKKIEAGAQFLITQPVFDVERFEAFWKEVVERGFQEKVAFVAGIRLLGDGDKAKTFAESRPSPKIPDSVLERLLAKSDLEAQQVEGVAIAVETIQRLSQLQGLRGFQLNGDGNDDAVLAAIDSSGLGAS